MKDKANLQLIEPLRKALRPFDKNNQCVYPGCKERPIGSHIIARSVLELLADQSKVFTLEHSDDDVIANIAQGYTWEHAYKRPKSIGIGAPATYPIFCSMHDNAVFAPLEKPGFSDERHRAALLAYRALCYKTWNPHIEEKLISLLSKKDAEAIQQNLRVLSHRTLLGAHQKVSAMLAARDYSQMRWIKRVFRIDPCFACTDAVIVYAGEEEFMNIARGNTVLTPEDIVTFTFIPEKNLNASVCVVTWFKDNRRGEQFIESLELNNPSEAIVRNNIITDALSMSLVYIAPT